MTLRDQALERAAAQVRIAVDANTNGWIAKHAAMRACFLIRDHGLLVVAGEGLALEEACGALVALAEALVCGCEHMTEHRVCGVCARHAHDAIEEAKRVMRPKTMGGH